MKLINYDYSQYLEVLSSNSPSPGGGSVSAMSGGLAVALFQMVCNITKDKKEFADRREEMLDFVEKTEVYKAFFTRAIDEDSEAFDLVIQAFRMPKNTEEEKSIRSKKIQEGYKHAAMVPFRVGEMGYEFIGYLEEAMDKTIASAITDIFSAALQIRACILGAFINVKINLKSIKDEEFVQELTEKIQNYEYEMNKRIEKILSEIEGVLI